jgi:transposase
MSGKVSQECKDALAWVAKGHTIRAAAAKFKLAETTIIRARARAKLPGLPRGPKPKASPQGQPAGKR